MRQEHPLEYKYTIELACDFNKGRVDVKHGLHDEKFTQWLTVMEHSVAMLAVRGWKSKEMASFFDFPAYDQASPCVGAQLLGRLKSPRAARGA